MASNDDLYYRADNFFAIKRTEDFCNGIMDCSGFEYSEEEIIPKSL